MLRREYGLSPSSEAQKTTPGATRSSTSRAHRTPAELLATYLVVLPIQVDVSKYVPPFLMNQIGEIGAKELVSLRIPARALSWSAV